MQRVCPDELDWENKFNNLVLDVSLSESAQPILLELNWNN